MTEFRPMPKIPRLSREIVITEKIDGTNASIFIDDARLGHTQAVVQVNGLSIYAGSRTRWVTPESDNFGFARWVYDHADELALLGPGHHFGEWWGNGINRGYGLEERRFSLFNTGRWVDANATDSIPMDGRERAPRCCHVVPVLCRGALDTYWITKTLLSLANEGSRAAPGFMDPEGIVVYHTAANQCFKKTIVGDEAGKHEEAHPKKVKPPRPPKDPSKGGRRKEQIAIGFLDRRCQA